jgi:uncharacterized membrane protein YdcZ (DUF606 family)
LALLPRVAVELLADVGKTHIIKLEVSSMKLIGILLLLAGMAGAVLAAPVPEMDPGSSASALALLSGALLVIKSRRNRN